MQLQVNGCSRVAVVKVQSKHDRADAVAAIAPPTYGLPTLPKPTLLGYYRTRNII